MRVALLTFGGADFVNRVHRTLEEHGHQLAVVVVTRYFGQGRPLSSVMLRRVADVDPSVPILVTHRLEPIRAALAGFAPDLILVSKFSWRLPPSILEIPPLGCVNVHPSSLPRYRGADPVQWQLYNGERYVGITLHRMDADFDTGPILLQWKMRIRAEDNLQGVWRGIDDEVVRRLPRLLRLVEAGAPGTAQADAESTDAPRFTTRERTIDWSRTAREIVNQIRAVGDIGALASLEGRSYRITRAEVVGERRSSAPGTGQDGHPPGASIQSPEDSMLVATGDGVLRVLSFRAQE